MTGDRVQLGCGSGIVGLAAFLPAGSGGPVQGVHQVQLHRRHHLGLQPQQTAHLSGSGQSAAALL
eukprot:CAMPEP_0206143036 /NCGR_PEP_ID=MMETSP1473-20131121/19108_1 /ASSEMBLY_ACC=CAM_ASM_001109 /TAXON_ID=1461547 /ORGANISM="Stichococcus sp, Strain RCC1054" /LENGTH=64 /DNA_ID=CAMNT_0053538269 /DNA_START=419 /DNA_END=609 /DNA_ORIENTATION=+